jgi:uncharacterized protein (DUF924 family)
MPHASCHPHAVLDFWFGAPGSAEYGTARSLWFVKSGDTDAAIRARFGHVVESALRGELDRWHTGSPALPRHPRHTLALIVLLDQFTRNIFRDTPRAFAGDARALEFARALVTAGEDSALQPCERQFVYLPFEHAEDMAAQEESVRLFSRLEADGWQGLEWARKHYDVMQRFGRYPHRNAILGRASTPDEVAFLALPGSRF